MGIHEDAARGDAGGVLRALDAGVAADTREPYRGRTPLMAAAASPRAGLAMVRLLIERGADVNARGWTPETAPADTAVSADPEMAEYQFSGDTALTLAASTGDLAVIAALLDAGADPQAVTAHGYDALINAVYGGFRHDRPLAAIVRLLLERGASPGRVTSFGETAVRAAAGFALFDVLALLLASGADAAQLRWSRLMTAVVLGGLPDVEAALAAGDDLEARDWMGRTALHLALQVGDLAKVRALREAGAALATGYAGRSPLVYAVSREHSAALAWLIAEGCDVDVAGSDGRTPLAEAVEAGASEAVRLLIEAGARVDQPDQYGQQIIGQASSPAIVRLLLAAGADLNQVGSEMRAALFGMPADAELDVSPAEYRAGKHRRFGTANPEVMDIPFWRAMVRARMPAYSARVAFDDTGYGDAAVWCFDRFGRTLTALPDGRYVEVAGEHEDFYDPDFCIYNDVVVYQGDGSFTIFGYPEEVFPPTDFHTATLVGTQIYLIGSLGYPEARRPRETPVYRLSCETWAIERVETRGSPPGWISRHTATYDAAAGRIVVRGGKVSVRRRQAGAPRGLAEAYVDQPGSYALDLATLTWRRLRG